MEQWAVKDLQHYLVLLLEADQDLTTIRLEPMAHPIRIQAAEGRREAVTQLLIRWMMRHRHELSQMLDHHTN